MTTTRTLLTLALLAATILMLKATENTVKYFSTETQLVVFVSQAASSGPPIV